jgi:hypothetical protein
LKVSIKPKIEPMEQFNVRLPASLKKRLEALRTRASELDADFNSTLVGVIEDFAIELEKRFETRSKTASKNPNESLGRRTPANGSDPDPARGEYRTDKPTDLD